MTPRTYRVRGTKELGYSIAVPTGSLRGTEYSCEYIIGDDTTVKVPEGALIYIPVKP
jgi:hypothetical protein